MAWQPKFYGEGHSFEMVLIPEGIEVMTRWEDFSPVPYKDAHKVGFKWAIAFGHVFGGQNDPIVISDDGKEFEYKGQPRRELTREEGMEIYMADVEAKMSWLRKKIKVPVTTFMFNSLGSLVLNAGEGNVDEGPVLPLLNKEFYVAAGCGFLYHNKKWVHLKDPKGALLYDEAGKAIMDLQVDNGLTTRRACEIALWTTRKDK